MLIVVLLVLQTSWGLTHTTQWVLNRLDLFEGASLTIDRIEGNVFRQVHLERIQLVGENADTLASIHEVDVVYRLGALFKRELEIESAGIRNLQVAMTQHADSTWDLLQVIPPDTTESSWRVLVGSLELSASGATANAYAAGRDSTYRIDDLNLRFRDLATGPAFVIDLEELAAKVWLPGKPAPVEVVVAGAFQDGAVRVDTLSLQSSESDVRGGGRFNIPFADSALASTWFNLTASPLAFDDIRLFVPALAAREEAHFQITLEGQEHAVEANLTAQMKDSASVYASGGFYAEQAGAHRYTLQSEVRRLTLRQVMPSLFEGSVNGVLSFDLTGASLDALSGTTRATLFNTRLAGEPIDTTRLNAEWRDGKAAISLDTGLDGASVALTGDARPFDAIPSFQLTGDLQNFDAALLADSSFNSDINASFDLQGEGVNLDNANLALRLSLGRSRLNRLALPDGLIYVDVDQDRFQFDAKLDTTAQLLTVSGVGEIGTAFKLTDVQAAFNKFDLMALLGDTTHSELNGRIEADVEWQGLAQSKGEATLSLLNSHYATYRIARTTFNGMLEDEVLEVEGIGETEAGSFDLAGRVSFDQETVHYEAYQGGFTGINIGALLPGTTQQSSLNGTFKAKGSGIELGAMNVTGQLNLTPSMLNRQPIDEARINLELNNDTLATDIMLLIPEGTAQITGQVAGLSGEAPDFTVTSNAFEGVDVGAFIGSEAFSTDLNGSLNLSGSGFDPASMEIKAGLTLKASAVNEAEIRDAFARVNLGNGMALLESDIWLLEGLIRLRADAQSLDDTPTYNIQGHIQDVDLSAILGQDSTRSIINLTIDGTGRGTNPRTMTMSGTVSGHQSNYQGIRVDTLGMAFKLNDGLLEVDTLTVVSNVALLSGSGPVALYDDLGERASNFTFEANLFEFAPLESMARADVLGIDTGAVRARIYGRPGTLRFDARADVEGLVYNTMHAGDLNGRLTGELNQDRTLATGEFIGNLNVVSIPGFLIEEIDVEAAYTDNMVSFNTETRIDANRNAELAGRYIFAADTQRVELDELSLKLDEDQWLLDQPAVIEVGQGYRVRRLLVSSGNQQFALDGVVDFSGTQNLLLTVENFRIGTVADLVGYSDLNGTLNGYFDLRGPAAAPLLDGQLDMNVIAFGKEAGDLSIGARYDSLRMHIDAKMDHINGQSLTARGYLPLNLTLARIEDTETAPWIAEEGGIDMLMKADSLALDWMLPFFDNSIIDRLGGIVTADVEVKGSAGAPVLSGEGHVYNGQLRFPFLGVTYEQIDAGITMENNIITMQQAIARTGEGQLVADGTIELNNLTTANLDIDINASQFVPVDTREYRATASGDLSLSGTLTAPVLKGSAVLQSGDLYLDEASTSADADINVKLTEADLLMLEREFGIRASSSDTTTFDLYEALAMDIDLVFERDLWIRSKKNPEMNVQFTGEVDLGKEPFKDPTLFGSLQVNPDRSYINQFGKRFNISLGTLTFNGPATDPRMDFEATYEVPSRRSQENAVTINLDMEGRISELDLRLSSEPTMELTDIVSYIVTSRPASEALQLGGTSATGASFAVNQGVGLLSGAIEGLVQGSGLELDVIQIEPRADARGATITAGKYVTPKLFTAVSQPIGASDTDGSRIGQGTVVTLELELIDALLLRLLGGESVMKVNLLWQHAY